MKLILPIALLLSAFEAKALDVCPVYRPIHEREVMARVQSGIPFKLLSIATDGQTAYRRIVLIQFDLWSEILTIETIGVRREESRVKESADKICKALSLPEAPAGHVYRYQLLLNPVLGESLKRLKNSGEKGSGLLQVRWQRLANELETEKVLIDKEALP